MNIGINIKNRRLAAGMSQKALAEAAGISQPFVFDIERENRSPSEDTAQRIAAALNCTVDDLLREESA